MLTSLTRQHGAAAAAGGSSKAPIPSRILVGRPSKSLMWNWTCKTIHPRPMHKLGICRDPVKRRKEAESLLGGVYFTILILFTAHPSEFESFIHDSWSAKPNSSLQYCNDDHPKALYCMIAGPT